MRKWDSTTKKYSYVIGLGDFHCKRNNRVNYLQIKQLNGIISACPRDKTKIIVEDVSSPNYRGKYGCGRYFVNSRGGILGGLTDVCKRKGFKSCQNIEYRFCRVVTLAPILNSLRYSSMFGSSSPLIKMSYLQSEIIEQMRHIRTYNDGKLLNVWYKQCINNVIKHMKLLNLDAHLYKNVKNYIDLQATATDRLRFVKKLLTFDSSLIDIEIVHAIVNASSWPSKLVIAGGSHIKSMRNILQKIGYETIYKTNVKINREYSTKKGPGFNISPGGFCYRPKPVDLTVLKRFL